MQSIDSIEPYAYRTSTDFVSEKRDIKYNNVIKLYKKLLALMILQKKKEKNIIQIDYKFLIIHTLIWSINNWRLWIWKHRLII